MRTPAVLLVIVAAACANASDPPPTGATIAGIAGLDLSLGDHAGACQVSYSGVAAVGQLELRIPWPCRFHVDRNGRVRTLAVGDAEVALVEHSSPHPELSNDCDTRVQALRITGRGVQPSEHFDRVAGCPPFQWDEPMFTGLFR